jgi:hypothetical protein
MKTFIEIAKWIRTEHRQELNLKDGQKMLRFQKMALRRDIKSLI